MRKTEKHATAPVADLPRGHNSDHAGDRGRLPRREGDLRERFTSQLVDNGTASQADIARAFHVPSVTVAALSAGEDPDQLSFLHAVRVVRRKMAAFGAIPPSGPKRVP